MPLQATSGAASYDAFGGGAVAVPQYIEDVFSTYLYTGNGSTQTITNGIDLSGKGGFVWFKNRGVAQEHRLFDTARGVTNYLTLGGVDGVNPQDTSVPSLTAFNNNGFNIGNWTQINTSPDKYASWTWRKQPKFFDIVTWTGSGANRTIAHNLGSVPACIIVKNYSDGGDWQVYHRSLANTEYLTLNSTAAKATGATIWNSTTPTSTVFSIGTDATVNASGGTYVAYIFAHDAGGFGLTGTDNVISCGSVTANGSGAATINLGYEPQWIMFKNITNADSWYIFDNMRGMYAPTTLSPTLRANIANAEVNSGASPRPSATGVSWTAGDTVLTASNTYIYIAIRRGPMKVPTSATKVFNPVLYTGTGAAGQTVTASGMNPADTMWHLRRVGDFQTRWDRLRGGVYLSHDSSAEDTTQSLAFDLMTGSKYLTYDSSWGSNATSSDMLNYYFSRAPNFFDVVCYTGTGSNTTVTHNLGVVPELIIVKGRSGATAWQIYSSGLANTEYLVLNTTAAKATGATRWNSTTPTSSVFSIGTASEVNTSAATYVAYLFATCAGVSKVGSYTGNGSTQTINCGFTGGARFVMIKKTSATSSWFVWDTSRGMTAGTDPRLFLNNPDGETNTNWVYTASTGFEIVTSDTNINASGSSYIFLAIA
jgi:hypothetical protein